MELSWIQKHALLVLIREHEARVRDLMPRDVAPNLFAYHLDGLVSMKLIEKTSRGVYVLTTKGQKFVGKFSTATNRITEEIKTVVMLYSKHGDEYLLFEWSRQPYLGRITPLYDRVPLGKSLDDGVLSALNDKLGIQQPVKYRGQALIKIMTNDEIVSHMNAVIYEVVILNSHLPYVSRNGCADMVLLDDNRVMNGVADFCKSIENASWPLESVWTY